MAAKEAPGLFESVKQWAAIGVLAFGTIALATTLLPAAIFNFLVNSTLVGGAVGVGVWAVNKLASMAKGPQKA